MDHAETTEVVETNVGDDRHKEIEIDSVTLARLLAEVRNGDTFRPGAYNRQHNRHNR